jgi:hypothetical protein
MERSVGGYANGNVSRQRKRRYCYFFHAAIVVRKFARDDNNADNSNNAADFPNFDRQAGALRHNMK